MNSAGISVYTQLQEKYFAVISVYTPADSKYNLLIINH